MLAPLARVGVLVVRTVKLGQALSGVATEVGVHDVQQHQDPILVAFVHQTPEVVGGAVPARNSVISGHMVPKAAVIGVFGDGHDLDRVIPPFFDTGQNLDPEFLEGGYPLFGRGHPDVALVNF